MLAGLKEWRPDLEYPESFSDMQGCARAVLRMFEIKRRAIAAPLFMPCDVCRGLGSFIDPASTSSYSKSVQCSHCDGRGKVAEPAYQ